MSNETQTPSAAKLRHSAALIASDISQAPLKNRNYEKLSQLNAELMALEKTMANTSDILASAITHTNNLVSEARRWSSVDYSGRFLRSVLDQSLSSILNVDEAMSKEETESQAVVSSETAHP